ncbi:rod shape-determining protein MreD [Streptomyces sp. TRM43335]|uniref:Rod shape-determining protein MreD n=1 Tax=Streptomyces taklimakanensis TaxID=2569853 RepID=A0A6G2BAW8_9ACTN|nr:rod shape-determining protein MreD [Streptomyces taklimakanensis]MTE19042.1 rod shape-determining protein MreD [Streptomyces taklimakanensis]
MHLNRILLSAALAVVALVLQVSVLARLQLPGAVPDLLLLTVLALALVYGHTGGALVGFGAGLLADLAPPADHAVGRYALVLCVVGYAAGLTKPESGRHRSATVPMLVVAGAALSSTLLYAGVGALVGDTAARHVGLGVLLTTATVYDLLLAPFTVPAVMALARRTEHDPLAEASGGSAVEGTRGLGGLSGSGGWLRGRTRAKGLGGAARGGGRRGGGLLIRSPKSGTGRIKGVKRL